MNKKSLKDRIPRLKAKLDKAMLNLSAATGTFRWIHVYTKVGAHAKQILKDSESVAANSINDIRQTILELDEIQRELWANSDEGEK